MGGQNRIYGGFGKLRAMCSDKTSFYMTAARGLAASTRLYKVDSIVHVEDEDDIWFWRQILGRYRPGRYKFMPGSMNEKGQHTTGCSQCLKYKDFLSQRFFICIDSDLRYMLDEEISAQKGILQTYTYSWENHCCFAEKLQQTFADKTGRGNDFDFSVFLRRYSEIVYCPFLLMLHQERTGQSDFDRTKFKELITLQYRQGDEQDNGTPILERLGSVLETTIAPILVDSDFDFAAEVIRYAAKGVVESNVYLYFRGHCLYNLIVSIGNRLCDGRSVNFEQEILRTTLAFERYDAISKIRADVGILNSIRYIC